MKKNLILGVLLLAAVYGGSMFLGHVSAQREIPKEFAGRLAERPDTNAPQTLPFSQNWTNAGLITADDDWSGVPGIIGYRGDALSDIIDVDIRTILADGSGTPVDVNANRSDPDLFGTGGIAEFDGIPNPVVAMQGSGTSDIPHIVLHLNTTGQSNIQVTYNARDIDNGTGIDTVQPINTQVRVGGTGDYSNVTGGYIADASGPGAATLVTPVSVTLPATANNQALVEVRIMTTNATGSDEFIGIDDISVTAAGGGGGTPTPTATPTQSPTPTPGGGTGSIARRFQATINGAMAVPTNSSTATAFGSVILNAAENQITASIFFDNLTSGITGVNINGPAAVGVNAPALFNLMPTVGQTSGSVVDRTFTVTPAQVADLRAGLLYFNIQTANSAAGEIRGQILVADATSDFNGDGRTDYALVRQTTSVGSFRQARWFTLFNVTNPVTPAGNEVNFGLNTDSVTPADFDGDGSDDIAIWRSAGADSSFFILQSATNTVRVVQFGTTNDDPSIVRDYDGDGRDDPAIFRAGDSPNSQGTFWWLGSTGALSGRQVPVNWGMAGDIAVPGDFNGDGKADFCVYRAVGTNGVFFVHPGTGRPDAPSVAQDTVTFFGRFSTDGVVEGDFDGDNRTDFAVRRSVGAATVWFYLPSSGGPFVTVRWGRNDSDRETPGDYDGDGTTDIAVWRAAPPSSYFIRRSSGGEMFQRFGLFDDFPTNNIVHE